MVSELTTEFWPHAQLHFHVLSHLDLGADAASIYRKRPGPDKPWVPGLLEAYRAASGRLYLQMLPLVCSDMTELEAALHIGMRGLDDRAGRELTARFSHALRIEKDCLEAQANGARVAELGEFLTAELQPLREHLWAASDSGPPALLVVDCEALRNKTFTHGRATVHSGRRVVAVSLAARRAQVLCQVLHEEIHPVTDPQVYAQFLRDHPDAASRDTAVGSAGFALHRELERAVVSAGHILLQNHNPQFLPAYARWRKHYSC